MPRPRPYERHRSVKSYRGRYKSLSGRRIGCLLVHHLGHDKTKAYGDATKEWQLDYVILGEGVQDPDASIALKIEFKKARRRRPATMADFEPGVITLTEAEWRWTGEDDEDGA